MLARKTLAVIGAGQMGEALFRGFLAAGIVQPEQILLSDVNIERLEALKSEYHVNITTDNRAAIERADIVLLAVKPQQIVAMLTETRSAFTEDKLVVSIAAGVPTEKIQDLIGKALPVIRVMPNTPALVSMGMSAVSRGKYAGDEAVEIALQLFKAVGEAIELPENLQNQVTAVSGSGPAYVFLMAEALIAAGVRAGLEPDAARTLVVQTIAGSAELLKKTGEEVGVLRERVTSPGGTTAAALQVFSNHEFNIIVQEAVDAAIKRAEELA
ncbi:MAG TPA: pyrroline-5-carboxylate reductase [Candidatus Aquicultor sp.]